MQQRADADLLVSTEITKSEDLLGPGAAPGTMPSDLEQATGLERLEILGKMQGVDIFDMKPLDASRKGAFVLPVCPAVFFRVPPLPILISGWPAKCIW